MTSVIDSPVRDFWPDADSPISMTTAINYLWRDPDAQEVDLICTGDFYILKSPRIKNLLFYDATASSYTEGATEAQDGDTSVVALDISSMTSSDAIYIRTEESILGFYTDLVAANDAAAVLTVSYNISQVTVTVVDYTNLTGAILTLFVNGSKSDLVEGTDWDAATNNNTTAASLEAAIEAVTGITSSASSAVITVKTDSSSYIITDCTVTDTTNLTIGTTVGAWVDTTQTDGTDSAGDTLKSDGLNYWTTKSDEVTTVVGTYPRGYWYKLTVNATLDSTTTIGQMMSLSRHSSSQLPTFKLLKNTYHNIVMDKEEYAGFIVSAVTTGDLTVNWMSH